MSNKLNVIEIFKCHLSTLVDVDDKPIITDYLVFFGMPFLFMGLSIYYDFKATDKYIDVIVTASSIFIGLLLNMLLLIYSQKKSIPEVNAQNQEKSLIDTLTLRHTLLQETFYNISYCIVVSIILVFISMSHFIVNFNFAQQIFGMDVQINYKDHILSPITIFLITNLLLSILMVVKRVYSLLRN